jgi:hypothetical protein
MRAEESERIAHLSLTPDMSVGVEIRFDTNKIRDMDYFIKISEAIDKTTERVKAELREKRRKQTNK